MPRFYVAMIRFHERGRLYPVNCDCEWGGIKSGTEVIVRMTGQSKTLQKAEVVETRTDFRRPCRNSIVCMAEDAEGYGRGPYGVETPADLERFLVFLKWKRHETAGTLSNEWSVLYREPSRYDFYSSAKDRVLGPFKMVVIGPSGVGARELQEREAMTLHDGRATNITLPFLRRFEKAANPLQAAAFFAEGDLTYNLDGDEDTTLSQIRAAISPEGGPVYLSDDVWI